MALRPFAMQPGDIIDRKYQVLHTLGEGGMGLVVAARELISDHRVAIKLLRPDIDDENLRRRFLREVRGVCQLTSEHVARAFAHGIHDDQPYIVMELLEGTDLQTQLDIHPLAPQLAARYAMQACVGLADAHALGIIHRDIKPANLMVVAGPHGEPIVKVLDFGIATASRNDHDHATLTRANMIVGSVSYMSPEQLRGAKVDARSDIWSLGVTLYELVSGRLPFPGDNFAAISIAIATEKHVPLYEATPALAKIVDRCLAKDPKDRYATVLELAGALAPLAGVIAQTATRPTIRALPSAADSGGFCARMIVLPEAPIGLAPVDAIPSLPSSIPSHIPSHLATGQQVTDKVRKPPLTKKARAIVASAAIMILAIVGFTAIAAGGEVRSVAAAAPAAPAPKAKPIVEPIDEPAPTVTPAAPETPDVPDETAWEPARTEQALVDHAQLASHKPAKRAVKRVAKASRKVARGQSRTSKCNVRDPRCLL
ncbi:MAG TPA: serine/threonine-protein kinase [Kofleriaceae bacterium]|nr:serine/threonine-protein kinase [Kofleriaceae bacterium]